jgi:acyl carrier protein
MSAEVFAKVRKIVSEMLDIHEDRVLLQAGLCDYLGADDAATVELMRALEHAFDIKIPDDKAKKMITIQDVVDFIEKTVQQPLDHAVSTALMMEQMLSDPALLENAINMVMPNASQEEKVAFRRSAEMIKNNPTMMSQMVNNPMLKQFNNPAMGGEPPMNNPMMNSPMMGSPMMSPHMQNPMMNPYMSNPYMSNPYMSNPSEPQDDAEIYANEIETLLGMGYSDEPRILRALVKSKGNIDLAIEVLTSDEC